jgi:hypothetical protein
MPHLCGLLLVRAHVNVRTADEALAHNIQHMGAELGQLYSALWQELASVHGKWEEYVELFGTSESRVELLNKAAGTFFRVVQDALWENTLIHIARLTDPPKSVGRPNLTLQRLSPAVPNESVRAEVDSALTIAKRLCEFSRDWRNRRIAHQSLDLAIGNGAEPLHPASRKSVKDALEGLSRVLNVVSLHYFQSTTFFDFRNASGGAAELIYVLDDGLRLNDERRKRLQSGSPLPEDWKPRAL